MTYRPARNQSAIRRVVLFGDSITDVCGGPRLDGSVQPFYANGWFNWMNASLRQRLEVIVNAAVSGDNTTGMLARMNADVLAYKPDAVFMLCGVNDHLSITDSSSRITKTATARTNLAAMYDRFNAAGVPVITMPIWPASAASHYTNSHMRQGISETNAWIRKQGYARKNLFVIDAGTAIADLATDCQILYESNGALPYTTDGLHPSATGACVIGQLAADDVSPLLWPVDAINSYNDMVNLVKNNTYTGASGSTEPTDWDSTLLAGTVSHSLVARTDGIAANWLELTLGSNAQLVFQQTVDTMTLATGDQYQASIEYDWTSTGGTQARCACLEMDFRAPNASSQLKIQGLGQSSMQSGGNDRLISSTLSPRSGIVKTPVCATPSAAAGGFIQLAFWSFGQGTLRIGKVSLEKVN